MNGPLRADAHQVPVVIVGAGPVGLTAATLLGQYGVECLVLDRRDGVYPRPRAVHLDDETYRVLARLGIAEQFAAVSRAALGLQLVDRTHHVLAEFDGSQGVHGHPKANMFDQPELEHLMRSNLEDQSRVTLRGNARVTDVVQDGRGRVRVEFTDVLTGKQESVQATYVLGCDGANSAVRATIGATMEDLRFEQRWLVVDLASTVELDQWEGVHQVCDPERPGTYMRVSETRYRWEFRLLDHERSTDFASVEALRHLIGPWVEDVHIEQLELVRLAEYTFRAQVADVWRDGNVFLLGDAAHLTPPFIGQGLCSGVRDSMNLSWKLAGVLSGDLPPSALGTYEVERKHHARALIVLAKLVGRVMTQGGRTGDLFRRAIAPRLHWVPGLRERLLVLGTPPLRRSSLVRARRPGRNLNGRLCPNALVSGDTRYDDVTGGGFVLVTGVPLQPEERTVLADRGTQVLEVEPGSPLYTWLTNGKAAAALVRPDFTVMSAGRDVTGLCAAAPRFLAAQRAPAV